MTDEDNRRGSKQHSSVSMGTIVDGDNRRWRRRQRARSRCRLLRETLTYFLMVIETVQIISEIAKCMNTVVVKFLRMSWSDPGHSCKELQEDRIIQEECVYISINHERNKSNTFANSLITFNAVLVSSFRMFSNFLSFPVWRSSSIFFPILSPTPGNFRASSPLATATGCFDRAAAAFLYKVTNMKYFNKYNASTLQWTNHAVTSQGTNN